MYINTIQHIYKYINRRLYFMYITSLKNLSCRHSLGCFRNSNSLTEECLSHRFGEPGTPRYRRSHHAVGSWHLCDETKYPSSGQAAITSSLGRLKSECTCGPHKDSIECFCFESFFSFQLLQAFVGRRLQVWLALYFLCKNMKEVFSGLQFLVLPKQLSGMADHESPRH